jgi:hypothetical protein
LPIVLGAVANNYIYFDADSGMLSQGADGTGAGSGRWEPLANGDPTGPALIFTPDGDVIMAQME